MPSVYASYVHYKPFPTNHHFHLLVSLQLVASALFTSIRIILISKPESSYEKLNSAAIRSQQEANLVADQMKGM